jgi:hypothetical protein
MTILESQKGVMNPASFTSASQGCLGACGWLDSKAVGSSHTPQAASERIITETGFLTNKKGVDKTGLYKGQWQRRDKTRDPKPGLQPGGLLGLE